jgi:hypothetical protein
MNNGAVTEVAMVSLGNQSSPAAQPTAQQAARFEQQLQMQVPGGGAQYYEAPSAETAGLTGNWRVAMNNMGKMAEQFRVDAGTLDGTHSSADASSASRRGGEPARAAEIFEQGMTRLSHMSYTMMSISFITTAERLAGENVRTLYQLG